MSENNPIREGSLEAPTRHPLDWKNPEFYDETALNAELERVFDICHGCRRCVSLCNSFPTLFDLVDESETMEVDGVDKVDFTKVVDQCYLCDLCYMTKCPYVPPHEWNVDFPHLMLRAKAAKFKKEGVRFRDKMLSSTDVVGNFAGLPIVSTVVNTVNSLKPARQLLDKVLDIHPDAPVPKYHSNTLRKIFNKRPPAPISAKASGVTQGKVVLFTTCYCNRNAPNIGEDLLKVFEHNAIEVQILEQEQCCGMPKLELGDLESVENAKNNNVPELMKWVREGWDIVAPIPSCVLMFKQELPLMFPEDSDVAAVKNAIFDPFEYLHLRHKDGLFNTNFKQSLGKVAYHAPCHLRVQNIGLKTRDILKLVPNTEIDAIERCSGHDGTYAVKSEFRDASVKIARPVMKRVSKAEPDHFSSDCPMAGAQIGTGVELLEPEHPMTLLRQAYGI